MDAILRGSVTYHFWVSLSSDLVCVQNISFILFEMGIQICCMDTFLDADMSHTILGHCDLDL